MLSLESPIGFNGLPNMNRRPFNPFTDIKSVTCKLNLNAVASQMTLVSSTHISQWNDQSTNGANGTQGTDAQRLIYNTTGGPANLPYVAFDPAAVSFVSFPDSFSSLTAAEVFVVRKVGADPPVSGAGSFMKFGTSGSSAHIPFTDGNIYDDWGSTVRKTAGNPTPSLANWHIYNVTSIAGEWTNRINGKQFFTTASNTVGFSATCTLGKGLSTSDGGMTSIWIFNGKLNAFERWGMHDYLNRTWLLGLTF